MHGLLCDHLPSGKSFLDGAELLLDLGLPSSIIGGVLLPLLGAIPDCAMIIFSGISGNIEDANNELSVGMGYVKSIFEHMAITCVLCILSLEHLLVVQSCS